MKAIWNNRFKVISTLVLTGMVTMLIACAKNNPPPTIPPISTPAPGTGGFGGFSGSIMGANCPTIAGSIPFHPQSSQPYFATLQGQNGINSAEVRLSYLYPPNAEDYINQFVGSFGFSVPGATTPGCASTVRPRTSNPMPGTLRQQDKSISGIFWGQGQVPAYSMYGQNQMIPQQQLLSTVEFTVQVGGSCPAYITQGTIQCAQGCNCVELWINDSYFGYTTSNYNQGYGQPGFGQPGYGYGWGF